MKQQALKKQLSNTELSAFCNQMAMILQSGISSTEGITIMLEDANNPEEKAILQTIYDTLSATGSFYEALKETQVFPHYALNMIHIGQQSGKLDDVMNTLCTYYEREENIAQAIKSAVTYPFIMIGMMLLIILVLIVKVLPIFGQVFEQLGREMNGFSESLLHIGNTIGRYSYVFIGIFALAIVLFFYFTRVEKGKHALSTVSSKLPMTRDLNHKIAAGKFAGGMSLTLSSGLTVEESLSMASQLTDSPILKEKIENCQNLITNGAEFSSALSESNIFSGVYARMVSVGFKTGALDEVLEKIANQYESEIDTKIGNTIAILEPTLVAVLSIIVGMILLSVMLPLMGILSGL